MHIRNRLKSQYACRQNPVVRYFCSQERSIYRTQKVPVSSEACPPLFQGQRAPRMILLREPFSCSFSPANSTFRFPAGVVQFGLWGLFGGKGREWVHFLTRSEQEIPGPCKCKAAAACKRSHLNAFPAAELYSPVFFPLGQEKILAPVEPGSWELIESRKHHLSPTKNRGTFS